MSRSEIARTIVDLGIIPIIRSSSTEDALAIADAILAGGIHILEVTMTVPKAILVLEKLSAVLGDQVVLGAGTVLDSETARVAILAGAEFIVSPNLNFDVIAMTKRYSKVSVPAGLTATEVVAGWEAGADFIKVFPCGCVGGPQYIKALKSPLPQIEMIPTGGVNLENAGDYIRAGAAAVAVGAELVDKEAVKNKTLHIITEKTRRYLEELKDARSEKGPWSAL
jgi:2-dehydro-3-deoxyphosphogluconate aldolase/(4S)-4-hydroxy-2-oxoglutarate aldolase